MDAMNHTQDHLIAARQQDDAARAYTRARYLYACACDPDITTDPRSIQEAHRTAACWQQEGATWSRLSRQRLGVS